MNSKAFALGAFAIGASVALSGPAFAEKMTMKVNLTSVAEVPPNNSPGKGTADVGFDTATKVLTWKVTYSGLTGPATMAHFHGPAEAGKNAPVAVPFKDAASGAEGSATLTDAQAADLLAGRMYINVHTEANKGGEIRGQVTK
ncbi:CHRD domain-containing protein [Bradyrhizobium sp. G127]|uniref:CHRD domain-containing protein n=1 Tax=Bradyrhizobium sp. G127 TaxID=2904800 RepID=UPI001F161067|nr:CHRD domain-containing protein [Bradyrhizobium sp. G127]MCF2524422.1 CHRD domain-containing protein [Bradyrhizobium sp. G127]